MGRCRRSGRAAAAPPPEAPRQRRALEAAGGGRGLVIVAAVVLPSQIRRFPALSRRRGVGRRELSVHGVAEGDGRRGGGRARAAAADGDAVLGGSRICEFRGERSHRRRDSAHVLARSEEWLGDSCRSGSEVVGKEGRSICS